MDDILVMMNQVDLTRPACISLIVATSEVYTLPCHFFLPPKGFWYAFVISHHIKFHVCRQWLLKFRYQIKVTDTFLAVNHLIFLVLTLTAFPEAQSSQIYVLHNVLCSTGSEVLQLVPGVSTATAGVLLCAVSQALLSGWCQHTLIPTLMKSVIFISVINVCRQSYREET